MKRIWCAQAWLGGDSLTPGVLVSVDDDGKISALTHQGQPPADVEALRGWIFPGFVNDHSHVFHRVLRGRTHAGRGSFWNWRDQMYAVAAVLGPTTYHELARAVFAEMLEAGYTQVREFHYLHHGPNGLRYSDANEMSRVLMAAATESGIAMTLLDTLYLQSAPGVMPDAVQMRFSDGDIDTWISRIDELQSAGLVDHGVAVHSVRAVPPDVIARVAAYARDADCALHAHVSEQPLENAECRQAYGRTPTQVFADAGALDDRFTAVHATHLTARDIELLAQSRVCMCPTTEAELADGIGPAAALRDAGVRLSIGTDSQAVIDPFAECRRLEWDQRLATGVRGQFTAAELAQIGCGSALRVGMRADLVELDPQNNRLAGIGSERLAGAVFAATGSDVTSVYVAGRCVVRDGRHRDISTALELTAAIQRIWAEIE